MSMRVINLGLPKSGTTTLARAMRRAGLRTADFRIQVDQTCNTLLQNVFVAEALYEGYFSCGDPLRHFGEFEALSELSLLREDKSLWPQTDWGLLAAIRAKHPHVKFVASWRDPHDMSDSMLAWSNLGRKRLPKGAVPGLPVGYGQSTAERVRWIDAHYAALTQFFAGTDLLLTYDTSAPDAPEQLSAHLDLSFPWWGRANRNPNRHSA
ncbi:MAG: sulfotransferase family protein [Marinovum sp.]|nr:sulfotransferase family protein [Marinovum sp.]